jgi:hypothetical protein
MLTLYRYAGLRRRCLEGISNWRPVKGRRQETSHECIARSVRVYYIGGNCGNLMLRPVRFQRDRTRCPACAHSQARAPLQAGAH